MTEYILDLTAFDGETLDDGLREEIVRCRDCKHEEDDVEGFAYWCNANNRPTALEGFCAWGARREGAES